MGIFTSFGLGAGSKHHKIKKKNFFLPISDYSAMKSNPLMQLRSTFHKAGNRKKLKG